VFEVIRSLRSSRFISRLRLTRYVRTRSPSFKEWINLHSEMVGRRQHFLTGAQLRPPSGQPDSRSSVISPIELWPDKVLPGRHGATTQEEGRQQLPCTPPWWPQIRDITIHESLHATSARRKAGSGLRDYSAACPDCVLNDPGGVPS
jgi:hypothetical protein